MKRRTWLAGAGTVLSGALSGCVGSSENGSAADDSEGGGDEGAGDVNESAPDETTDGTESEMVENPDGDAETTVRLELGPGFAEPEAYEIVIDLSHVAITRANENGGVVYPVDRTLTLRKGADSEGALDSEYVLSGPGGDESGTSSEYTLVDRADIPVATYEYLRIYGSVSSYSASSDGVVELSGGDLLQQTVGSVFEAGDRKEYVLGVAVRESDQGYEVTTNSLGTITW